MPTVFITPEAVRKVNGPYVHLLRSAGFEIAYPRYRQFCGAAAMSVRPSRNSSVADATIASGEYYSERVLKLLPRLRVIARCGVGYDRVDVPAATAHNVVLTITPTTNRRAVAELALGLMFGVAKALVFNDQQVRSGNWPLQAAAAPRGKVLGIFGLGRIGGSLAVRAKVLGMTVIATERQPDPEFLQSHQIELADFDTLLARSDFLSIHCPLNDHTQGLFNQQVFQRMKPGSILINTSRAKSSLRKTSGRSAGTALCAVPDWTCTNRNRRSQTIRCFSSTTWSSAPTWPGRMKRAWKRWASKRPSVSCSSIAESGPSGAVINEGLRKSWRWDR